MKELTPQEAAILAAAEEFFDRYDRGLVEGAPIVGIMNNPFIARGAVAAAPVPAPKRAAPPRKKDKRSARHTKRRGKK